MNRPPTPTLTPGHHAAIEAALYRLVHLEHIPLLRRDARELAERYARWREVRERDEFRGWVKDL